MSVLHGELLRHEKIDLIDQQVRETASALLDSELGDLRKIAFERVDAIISEELGENRIGKFFIIRNNAGDILFESAAVRLLPLIEVPRTPRWISIHKNGLYIRILNLELPRINDRTLQVGVLIDEALISPRYFSKSNTLFTGAIVAVGLLSAWILTSLLMRPISQLSSFVQNAAGGAGGKNGLPPLPGYLKKYATKSRASRDELYNLLRSFETLIERVNKDYRLSRFWSYQMAHELKTPMALIEAQMAEGVTQNKVSEQVAESVLSEVFGISETITSFLTWAETENASIGSQLFVVRAGQVTADCIRRLNAYYDGRLGLELKSDFDIMANIQHLEHALNNLAVNALKYSPSDKPVTIEIGDHSIAFIDSGPGIPPDVLERLGEPFNRGGMTSNLIGKRSNGLGLALIHSISKLYGWKIGIESSAKGTIIRLTFPNIESEMDAGPGTDQAPKQYS